MIDMFTNIWLVIIKLINLFLTSGTKLTTTQNQIIQSINRTRYGSIVQFIELSKDMSHISWQELTNELNGLVQQKLLSTTYILSKDNNFCYGMNTVFNIHFK